MRRGLIAIGTPLVIALAAGSLPAQAEWARAICTSASTAAGSGARLATSGPW